MLFLLEAIVKIIGLGKSYFSSPWNCFDFGIVVVALLEDGDEKNLKHRIVQIAAGRKHTVMLSDEGQVLTCGRDGDSYFNLLEFDGRLGHGSVEADEAKHSYPGRSEFGRVFVD